MNILETIVIQKKKEISLKKSVISVGQLERSYLFNQPTRSLSKALQNSSSGIIAEHKRRSPSKSVINQTARIQDVALGYEIAGACGMSVLTDGIFFGGSLDDLILARASCNLPLLRKDFIIDPYQVIEAKAHGADVILLISAILDKNEFQTLANLADSLNMEVLAEVHDEMELDNIIDCKIDLLGVNNRNLKTFDVNLEISRALSKRIPQNMVKVSESGISSIDAINDLRNFGYKGFLIGETFMKTDDPGKTAEKFIKAIKDET
ncbi:MAG: indole-3-glycerol phosphate synthase TrpC [Flavobacteriaceae bacterium]|nr:indole-3-glycerol phosphate synthase TrpC [Bacteroidia bacterium]MBT8289082.1 indole-3-glycerol phosphate synthase TrpC [Bacteroidia bacterium]NNF74973.1 indole-3-glycerol phosphate synthase TrpC [Flavobacteriaceae bacterium]NNK86981.1 indole-3-glycerol phosphate synthase TrpC [Flavobacteriaceae bacterium]